MSRKNRNGMNYLDDLSAYLENRMSEEERNLFERRMEADPFLREAVEGLSATGIEGLNKDVGELETKIARRTTRRRLNVWYRVSAAVVFLLVISSVFLVRELRNPALVATGEIRDTGLIEELTEPVTPVTEVEDTKAGKSEKLDPEVAAENNFARQPAVKSEEVEIEKVAEKVAGGIEVLPATEKNEAIILQETQPEKKLKSVARQVPVSLESKGSARQNIISGTVLSSDDSLPLPGTVVTVKGTGTGVVTDYNGNFEIAVDSAQTLVASFIGMQTKEVPITGNDIGKIILDPDLEAINEVVVVGFGLEGKAAGVSTGSETVVDLNKDETVYIPAQPEGGMTQFREYVEKNQVFPAGYTLSDREVVILKFTVSPPGEIYDFEIIRGPSEEFNSEAMRLVREGPAWEPAMENGNPVVGTVRLRIVFRK